MKNTLDAVDRLAACTCLETAFPVDVSAQVIFRIRHVPRLPVWPVVFLISIVAVAAVFIFPVMDLFTDPWSACFAILAEN